MTGISCNHNGVPNSDGLYGGPCRHNRDAACRGHARCLHIEQCDKIDLMSVIFADSLECVQLLRHLAIGLDPCRMATMYGRLEILQYLRSIGCPWDQEACYIAAQANQPRTLKYTLENGLRADDIMYSALFENDAIDCLKVAYSIKPPTTTKYLHGKCEKYLATLK